MTMNIHKNKVLADGSNLLDLLKDDDKQLAVATFNKFGKSSTTDCSSEKFIENLVSQQYSSNFRSTICLQPDYSYEQVIENPHIKHGLITLQDFKNGVQFYDSKSADHHTKLNSKVEQEQESST